MQGPFVTVIAGARGERPAPAPQPVEEPAGRSRLLRV